MWNLEGRIRFKTDVIRKNAKTRFRNNLVSGFDKFGLASAKQSFTNHLERGLIFEEDSTPLCGETETHFWITGGDHVQPSPPALAARAPSAASIVSPPPPAPFYADARGGYGHLAAAYPGHLPFSAAAVLGAPAAAQGGAPPARPVGPGIIGGGPAAAPAAARPPPPAGQRCRRSGRGERPSSRRQPRPPPLPRRCRGGRPRPSRRQPRPPPGPMCRRLSLPPSPPRARHSAPPAFLPPSPSAQARPPLR